MDRETNVKTETVPELNYIQRREDVEGVEMWLHALLIREYMGVSDHLHIPKASPRQKYTETSGRSLGGPWSLRFLDRPAPNPVAIPNEL